MCLFSRFCPAVVTVIVISRSLANNCILGSASIVSRGLCGCSLFLPVGILMYLGSVAVSMGMSHAISRDLACLELHERPVHCCCIIGPRHEAALRNLSWYVFRICRILLQPTLCVQNRFSKAKKKVSAMSAISAVSSAAPPAFTPLDLAILIQRIFRYHEHC